LKPSNTLIAVASFIFLDDQSSNDEIIQRFGDDDMAAAQFL